MDENLFERIQLSFSLENCLKGPTYQIEFFLKDYDKFETETEKINKEADSTHIEFTKTFNCDYHFSKIQFFTVNVIRRKDRQKMTNFKAIDENNKKTLSSIVASKDSIFTCPIRASALKSENLIIKAENPNYLAEKSKNNYTYFDFIKHGIKLKCYIGIDFTQGSDHGVIKEENQYLQAIEGFRETLFSFVRDFEVYGYGAKINETNEKPGFFRLNFNDKSLHGYTEIEKSYQECLKKISFCESEYLSPLIEKIKSLINKNYELNTYNIFFLLISNPPVKEDYQKCIDLFVTNTFLPLSVIIVGIGNKEFKEIKYIISKNRKCSSEGVERARNNIYFVSMYDCNYNNEILKNRCLKEIPKQVVEFYKLNKTSPDDVRENKLENIKKSIEKSFNIINIQNNNKVIINDDNYKDKIDQKPSKVLKLKENNNYNNNNEIKDSQDDSDNNFNLFKDSDKDLNNKILINNNNKDIINDNINKNNIAQNTKHENKKKERINEINSNNDLFYNDFNIISPNDNYIKESNFVNKTPENRDDVKNKQNNIIEKPFSKENKQYRETPCENIKNENKNLENPFCKEKKLYRETPCDNIKNENKNLENPFCKENKLYRETPCNNIKKENKNIENPFCKENKLYRETPCNNIKNEIKNIENPFKKSSNIKKKENIKDKVNEIKEKDKLLEFPGELDQRRMPNETPSAKEREQLQNKFVNPYTQIKKKEESNRIAHQINDNGNKKKERYFNVFMEKEGSEGNKPKNINNPNRKQQYHAYNSEQINNNNNKKDKLFYNETPNANFSQKYQNMKNPYVKEIKADNKKFCNETPGNQLDIQIKNYKSMTNPYRKNKDNFNQNQNQSNPFRKANESNQNDIVEKEKEINEEKEKKEKSNNTGRQFSQMLEIIKKKNFNVPKKINSQENNEKNMEIKFTNNAYHTNDN